MNSKFFNLALALVFYFSGASAVVAENPTANNPIPALLYTVDRQSPTVNAPMSAISPGDILRFPGPVVVIPRQNLGLQSEADDVDGLSRLNSGIGLNATFVLRFSVDRAAEGARPPDPNLVAAGFPYNVQQQAALHQAAGDDYFTLQLYTRLGAVTGLELAGPGGNHTQGRNQGDAGGVGYSLVPEISPDDLATPPVDNLDGGAKDAVAATEGADGPVLLFSLTSDSPSLEILPGQVSGSVIFIDQNTGSPAGQSVYAGPAALNISSNDDIDAFVVFDNGDGQFNRNADQILFSLSPGSQSVLQGQANPGDIYTTTPTNNAVFAAAGDLGLLPSDNIDMISYELCSDLALCVDDWAIGNKPPVVPAGSWWSYGLLLLTVLGVGVWVLRTRPATNA
ncbi:MAG: hypothetical protein AB7N71_08680 [Phycisphaerae bacterium]